MQYLSWCEKDKWAHPEWMISIAIWPSVMGTNIKGKQSDLIINWPLYAYEFDSKLGHKEVERQCVSYLPVSVIFPLHTAYHRLDAAMIKEVALDIQLTRSDHHQIIRAITFLKCDVTEIKEYDGEITVTFNYVSKGDLIKTNQGVHFFNFNYEEYTGIIG